MIHIDISNPEFLPTLASNMKREATFAAKGESKKVSVDFLLNHLRLFEQDGNRYTLMLSVLAEHGERYWHLSIGGLPATTVIPPDQLCWYLIDHILGLDGVLEGENHDKQRPGVRHFLKKII